MKNKKPTTSKKSSSTKSPEYNMVWITLAAVLAGLVYAAVYFAYIHYLENHSY